MKYTILGLLVAVLLGACSTRPEAPSADAARSDAPLDPIVARAKETSFYADRVDWNETNRRFVELRKEHPGDLLPALQVLINRLGDRHAGIRSAKDFSLLVSYTGPRAEKDDRDSDFVDRVINDVSTRFSYKLLSGKVGYLKVVAIGGGVVKEQADEIRKGLIDLDGQGVDQWILDLRFNGGGNMEPMISGLAPLFGDGFIGGAVNARNETTREYQIKDGEFFNSERLTCEMPDAPTIAPEEKIAVLLSRYTASSGELVAVALKGRPNTRFIGEETAGYTTGNGFDPITDELFLLLSQDLFMDRNRKSYPGRVGVDEPIPFQPDAPLGRDPQISRALEWLDS